MAEVVLSNVCKRYEGGALAVDHFSLKIGSGEFLVLVGPSGCGKSTTLRMVAGLEALSSGTISIDGGCVNTIPPKTRDIAMVFQNYALYPHMTVFENMAFGLRLRKVPKREIAERVGEAADILGLGDLLQRVPKHLSGGQRQRVAVGRAIVRKPKVFLFDEPLSNLDAKLRVEMRSEISRLHRRLGATMIYVTHDQMEAMTMGDRIVVMHQGAIQQAAPPLEVYRRPANLFVAGFVGTPPMNFLRGRVVKSGPGTCQFCYGSGCLPVAESRARALAPFGGQELVMGFRPESLGATECPPGCAVLSGVVDVVEPMGSETFVQVVATCGSRLIARVGADRMFAPGSAVSLPIDLTNVQYFDGSTGRVISDGE